MRLTGILAEIIETKREEIADAKKRRSVTELAAQAVDMPPVRGFRSALAIGGCALIAEIKTASPSRGLIRGDVDPLEVARIYEANGASCISVLTDERYFRGSLERLEAVRREVELPLLRKDFIIDPYQIYEARCAGADAILLIAACLEEGLMDDLSGVAGELELDTMIEVHDEKEMMRVAALSVDLIGINNRDLRTFTTDLSVTGEIAAMAPDDAVLVSESGIFIADDVRLVHTMGADAILVGEAIMASQDMGAKVRELAHAVG